MQETLLEERTALVARLPPREAPQDRSPVLRLARAQVLLAEEGARPGIAEAAQRAQDAPPDFGLRVRAVEGDEGLRGARRLGEQLHHGAAELARQVDLRERSEERLAVVRRELRQDRRPEVRELQPFARELAEPPALRAEEPAHRALLFGLAPPGRDPREGLSQVELL